MTHTRPHTLLTLSGNLMLGALLSLPLMVGDGHAQNLKEWLGRDLVERSLNKRIVVIPQRSWTEHRPAGTGIDRHVIRCPRKPLIRKGETWAQYHRRLNTMTATWTPECR